MEKSKKRRAFGSRSLLWATAVFCTLLFGSVGAVARTSIQPFSADVVRMVNKKISKGKIYATENAVRAEMEGEAKGQESITIVLLDRNEIHALSAAQKLNTQLPYIDGTGAGVAEFAGYLEGAETQRESLGSGEIGKYHCEKYRVEIAYKGHVYSRIEWAAKELDGFVVRIESEQGEWSTEYSDVRLGPQDPSLFEIPADYKTLRFSKDWSAIADQMKTESNPAKAAARAHAAGLKVIGEDPTLFTKGHPQNQSDYGFEAVDPVTGVGVISMHVVVDYLPPKPPSEPLPPKNITVEQSDSGSDFLFDVSFVIPDEPSSSYKTITIYGMQIIGAQRSTEKSYPSVQGHWQPNERVRFSISVPKEYADPSRGWDLTFCVGSAKGCYPSPNLLTLITHK